MPPHTPSPAYLRQPSSDSAQTRRNPSHLPPPVSQPRARTAGRTVRIAPGTSGGNGGGGGGGSSNPARAPTRSGTKLGRSKTLTRPDRHVQAAPLLNPHAALISHQGAAKHGVIATSQGGTPWYDPWSLFAHLVTFWAPPFLLSALGKKDQPTRQAWREKMALCFIALLMGGFVGFATIGLNRTLCPETGDNNPEAYMRLGENAGYVGIDGWQFSVSDYVITNGINLFDFAQQLSGQDVSFLFDRNRDRDNLFPSCRGNNAAYATTNLCANATAGANAACALNEATPQTLSQLRLRNASVQVGYAWEQVSEMQNYMVLDGNVLNMAPYLVSHPQPISGDPVDVAIRYVLRTMDSSGGKDATRLFYNRNTLKDAVPCIIDRYHAGRIDKVTPGCFASQLFLYFSLVVIMGVVLARFAMALVFSWFLSHRLVRPPRNLKRKVKSPGVLPEGAVNEVNNPAGVAPWINKEAKLQKRKTAAGIRPTMAKAADAQGMINMASIGSELFCVCLVTCYSEGAEGIGNTLDSISGTDYSDARKLLFVVCDGMITGSGEKMSTPDICVGMLEADPRFGNPQPMSYLAVAAGAKEHNMAMIYAGHYTNIKGHRTPMLVIVKCGTPEEATDKKPGNRGKRDSQMILMNFFSRVTYNDRMTPLDYDLFRKIQALMGVTPDFFEVCLMVDADTKVYRDSLKHLVNSMQHDWTIMGVCGETRIANKRQSWVTAIQVYEYFISHHLAKAFESVFGGVTCLPGCFSMYRLKARRYTDGDWIPILAQPEICREYSQSTVTTLHQKNLLLLGEDRFLTTLMIRTFPARKMMFCPQAKCRTVAPDTFSVLLSQRRRWINSTIHNLMELVRVPNLCGTFCFSMQFVVFMELIGTVVLPVAICLTYSLIAAYILDPPKDFASAIPLLLLGSVLGLPAILILLTSRKIVYVGWMFIYLLALPVWNLVLPVWAFAHFDDFSWGETRKVAGEGKDTGHGDGHGDAIAANTVPLRRWADWERSRLRKIKREEKRKKDFELAFGTRQFHNMSNTDMDSRLDGSDSASVSTYEDDRWGMQIGYYEEARDVAPPVGLYQGPASTNHSHADINAEDMERMLSGGGGWDEDDSPPRSNYGAQDMSYGANGGGGYYPPQQQQQQAPMYPSPVTRKLYSLQDDGPVQAQAPNYGSASDVRNFSGSSYGGHTGAFSPPPSSPKYEGQQNQGYYDQSRTGQSSAVEDSWTKGHMHRRSGSHPAGKGGDPYGYNYRGDI